MLIPLGFDLNFEATNPLMPSRHIGIAILSAAIALTLNSPLAAQVVSRFEVRETVISPGDGDSKQDSTRVRYSLSVAATVSLVVFAADSTTAVDTLRAPAAEVPSTIRDYYWKGRREDGTFAGEGAYVVTLRVTPASGPDVVRSLPIFVDTTPPRIQIVSVVPDPYAPGLANAPTAVSVSFLVDDASPVFVGRPPDELKSEFANPSNVVVVPSSLVTSPPFTGASGAYTMAWNATSEAATLPDGEFRVTLSVIDAAGYSAASTYHFSIDTADPRVKATSLAENASVRAVPDSLRGFAFDRRGVDSLLVRYQTSRPFVPVASTYTRDDTLFFAVPLADSIRVEGSYTLDFRAVDGVGRAAAYAFTVHFDTTAPCAPSIEPFNGTVHNSSYRVAGDTGTCGDVSSFVRVLRNGIVVDSVSIALGKSFVRNVPLERGRNEIVTVLRDAAFNTSPPSNTVVVTFDQGAGLFAPAPFTPAASFAINAPTRANGATLKVFDLAGDLVATLEDASTSQFYSLPWNGHNGSGVATKRGPLVAVAVLVYPDGTREILREVFLYNPDAQ